MRRSLRMRLLAGAAMAILAALGAAWFAMTLLFERHVERQVELELTRHALELVAGLRLGTDGSPALEQSPADSRFEVPGSGLYWQLSTAAGAERSRSLWDQLLPRPDRAASQRWATRVAPGPFGQHLLLLEREVRPDTGGAAVLVQLAEDRAGLRLAAAQFGRELALFLGLLWAILTAAAWVQVDLGLKPLQRVRASLAGLRRDPEARLDPADVVEIEPLVSAINALANARELELGQARRRASDLAHSLKTPLAAVAALSRRAADSGIDDVARGLERAVAAASTAVEIELARARAATARRAVGSPGQPRQVTEALIGVLEHTDFAARVAFDVDVPEDLRVPVATEDLTDLLGPLLENAARFARRRVRVKGRSEAGGHLVIEDDGPGMDPAKLNSVMTNDGRLDETAAPRGRGLLIARNLVQATGGLLTMSRSPLGGLQVEVSWNADGTDNAND